MALHVLCSGEAGGVERRGTAPKDAQLNCVDYAVLILLVLPFTVATMKQVDCSNKVGDNLALRRGITQLSV